MSDNGPLGDGEARGRGRPRKPPEPVPPWPTITGELQFMHDAFKRGGEVIGADFGSVPAKPPTFIYRGSR